MLLRRINANAGTVLPDPNAMTFGEHLDDLRRRLIFALMGLVPIAIGALIIGVPALEFLMAPVQEELRARRLPASLQATGPGETFGSFLRISLAITVVVGAPWAFYQLWLFVAPGLRAAERRVTFFLLPLSITLTISGLLLMYVYMLPLVLAFFIGFGSDIGRQVPTVAPLPPGITLPSIPVLTADPPSPAVGECWINTDLMQIRYCIGLDGEGDAAPRRIVGSELVSAPGILQQYRISEYIKLLTSLAISFIAGFQTPVVVLLLGWAGIVEVSTLTRYRRQAIMLCAVVGSVLTPSDPISLFFLAIPLYLLFELGVILLRWFPPSRIMGKEPPDAGDD